MKTFFNKLFFIQFVGLFLFVSCSKQQTSQPIEDQLANDVAFRKAIVSTIDFGVLALNADIHNETNIKNLQDIITKVANKTATSADYTKAEELLGTSYSNFKTALDNWAVSLNDLNKKYPQLQEMNNDELAETFTKAINKNAELKEKLATPVVINGRVEACPLRDICKLAVTLTNLFAGQTICAAIGVTTIPVVGGILCQIVLTLGTSILNGVCNALPC